MSGIIEDEMNRSSVIKDEKKLDFDYIPEDLPHREDQMRRLAQIFRPVLQNIPQTAVIRGPVGCGKTVLAKKFCLDLTRVARKQNKNIEYVHINCRKRSTDAMVMLGVLNYFDERFPDRGFSVQEMIEVLKRQLKRREAHLIIVLDEADALIKKSGSDLIYMLTRFKDESVVEAMGVSVLMISQKDVLADLDDAALSTFKRANNIVMEKYGRAELLDIINQRVDLAFHLGTMSEQSVELIADIASEFGDARFAIELMQNAAALASDDHRDMVVPEHVRAAKANVYSVVTETKLEALNRQQLIALLSVAKALKKDDIAYVTTGEVEKSYQISCEEFGDQPRGHTMFWKYLKEVEGAGFIGVKPSGKGMVGTTQLISLPDVPANVLAAKVEAILPTKKE